MNRGIIMHHYHGTYCQHGEYPTSQPGLVALFGSMIGLGQAAMWSGARLIKHVVEGAIWGGCGDRHHGHHQRGCGHHEGRCAEYHHYVIDCSPHGHCGCSHHGC